MLPHGLYTLGGDGLPSAPSLSHSSDRQGGRSNLYRASITDRRGSFTQRTAKFPTGYPHDQSTDKARIPAGFCLEEPFLMTRRSRQTRGVQGDNFPIEPIMAQR